jgi:chromosome segregation ATPase
MLAEEDRVRTLETEIAILKRDISQYSILFTKIDITIEKLSDVSNNIGKLLAAHEERIDFLHSMDKEMDKKLESKSQEIKELSAKVESMNMYVIGEIANTEVKLKEEIASIKSMIQDKQKEQMDALDDISKKVQHIEKWKWMIIGFAIAAGALTDKLSNFLSLIP